MGYNTGINAIETQQIQQVQTQTTQPTDNQEENYFSNLPESNQTPLNQDAEELDFANPQSKDEKLAYIYTSYQKSKDEQGIIGSISNGIKNLFGTANSPKNLEKAISSLNENSTDKEINAVLKQINEYEANQEKVVKTTGKVGAAATGLVTGFLAGAKAGALVGSVVPGAGNIAGALIGGAVGLVAGATAGLVGGAFTDVTLNQLENMTDKVKGNSWQNDENILTEARDGATYGTVGGSLAGGAAGMLYEAGIGAVAYGGIGGSAAAVSTQRASEIISNAAKNLPTDFANGLTSGDAKQYLESFGELANGIKLIPEHTYQFLQSHGAMQIVDETTGQSVIQIVQQLSRPIEQILNYGK